MSAKSDLSFKAVRVFWLEFSAGQNLCTQCNMENAYFMKKKEIQSTLVISTSVISNNRLSRRENLTLVST